MHYRVPLLRHLFWLFPGWQNNEYSDRSNGMALGINIFVGSLGGGFNDDY
jgi:hypothetical protein